MRYIALMLVLMILAGCSGTSDTELDASDSGVIDASGDIEDTGAEPTRMTGSGSAADLLPLCLGVQNPMYMQMCSAALNKDAKMCDDVRHDQPNDQEYFQDMCRIWVAAARKDFDSCDKIDTTIQGQQMLDCKRFVAVAMGDEKLCNKLDSENNRNGCLYAVKAISKVSDCIEPECVYSYALAHNDKAACDYFGEVTSVYVDVHKFSCLAMLDKDTERCRQLGDMFSWEMCLKKAGLGKAILGNGNYEPSACEDDDLCIRAVLVDMVSYVAKH